MVTTRKVSSGSDNTVSKKGKAGAVADKAPSSSISQRRLGKKSGDDAVQVDLSEEGKELSRQGASNATEDGKNEKPLTKAEQEELKTSEEKKTELVDFYAKQLVKATKKIDVEELAKQTPEIDVTVSAEKPPKLG